LASFDAIAATGSAIRRLLADACPRQEFPAATFEIYDSRNLQKPMEEGISLYLYQVGPSVARQNPRPRDGGMRRSPPVWLDLHYLLTAWGRTPDMQHRLLGWAVRTLEDTRILPPPLLNDFSPGTEVFGANETVELVCEMISIQDLQAIWEVAQTNQQLSIGFVARAVALDSLVERVEERAAQTREFDFAKVT